MNNCKVLNLCMTRGDTLSFDFSVDDLEIDNVYFSCRKEINDANYVFQKTTNDDITLIDAEAGEYNVKVAPEDTENVELGNYYYDLQINVGSDKYTILKGSLKIDYDITRGV